MAQTELDSTTLAAINKQGVALFKAGKIDAAIQHFEDALMAHPGNVTLGLNAAHTMLACLEKRGKDKALIDRVSVHLELGTSLSQQDSRFARHQSLKTTLQKWL